MHIVGYCRVSTEDQANEGVSLDVQQERIAAWCALRGKKGPSSVYLDRGISGKRSDNRPGLQSALDEVCQHRGVLVVYSLSRLARSVRDTLAIAERIERATADLVSLSEQIDTTSASGKMIFRLLAVMAEFERDLISERTKGALNHKRAKGERIGQIPYGSRLDPDGRTLVPDDAERRIVGRIRRMKQRGESLRGIAATLDSEGVVPKKGGPKWAASTIRRLIAKGGDDGEGEAAGVNGSTGQAQPELPAS